VHVLNIWSSRSRATGALRSPILCSRVGMSAVRDPVDIASVKHGSPLGPRQLSRPAYLYGAICPARGTGAAIIMPAANTEGMNEHLKEISSQAASGAHAVIICDGAGWHRQDERLEVPDRITLLP
jgi:hypothetical protein